MPEIEKATCLVLILDLGSLLNNNREGLPAIIENVTIFCSSYLVMHRNNQIVLLLSSGTTKSIDLDSETLSLLSNLQKMLKTSLSLEAPSLSRCLSTALCIVNRRLQESFLFRILVLQFDKDVSINYNGVMNSIFSAQKLDVSIDALVMCTTDSHLLQQACFLTGGLYLRQSELLDFQKLLQIHYLSDKPTRQHLVLPLMKSVDFKSACRCHKKLVQFAYMCSVCLALSCSVSSKCLSCETPAQL